MPQPSSEETAFEDYRSESSPYAIDLFVVDNLTVCKTNSGMSRCLDNGNF